MKNLEGERRCRQMATKRAGSGMEDLGTIPCDECESEEKVVEVVLTDGVEGRERWRRKDELARLTQI